MSTMTRKGLESLGWTDNVLDDNWGTHYPAALKSQGRLAGVVDTPGVQRMRGERFAEALAFMEGVTSLRNEPLGSFAKDAPDVHASMEKN